jgi:hypothetical protein
MDDKTGDDSFELPPGRVGNGRRPWVTVVGVAGIALAIVLVAALSGGSADPAGDVAGRASGGDAVAGSPAPSSSVIGAAGETPAVARPMPGSIACHDVDRFACNLAVSTALGTLDVEVPAVATADVWPGLVCGDTLDCPANRLDGRSTPLANVILRLAGGGPAAWVNVVYRSHGRPLDFDPTVEAWIARWQALP